MNEMYSQQIIEHYSHPYNFGKLKEYSHKSREVNSLCGDEVEIFLNVNDERIKEVSFTGQGCAISQAASSMLTEAIKGKSLDEIKKINASDVIKMLGITISPVRMKCALISYSALISALKQ